MWKRQGEGEIAPLEMEVRGSALIFHDQHYYLVNTSLSWAGRAVKSICTGSRERESTLLHMHSELMLCNILEQQFSVIFKSSHSTTSQDLCQTNPGKVLDGPDCVVGGPFYIVFMREY